MRELATRAGLNWWLDVDDETQMNVEHEIFNHGVWEAATFDMLKASAKAGESFVDVGAHIGWYTVTMAANGLHVTAFEPVPEYAETLRRNLDANGLTADVVPQRLCAAGRCLDQYALDSCDWLKIDTDGWELQVIRGAVDTIRRHMPVILFEVCGDCMVAVEGGGTAGERILELFGSLADLGYSRFLWSRALKRVGPGECIDWMPNGTMDVFAVPPGRQIYKK